MASYSLLIENLEVQMNRVDSGYKSRVSLIQTKLNELEEKKRILQLEMKREEQQRIASWRRIQKKIKNLKEDIMEVSFFDFCSTKPTL